MIVSESIAGPVARFLNYSRSVVFFRSNYILIKIKLVNSGYAQ